MGLMGEEKVRRERRNKEFWRQCGWRQGGRGKVEGGGGKEGVHVNFLPLPSFPLPPSPFPS